ncbi:uncharacterized protein LOC115899130 [Rhinopithecus roxellana]|uniref:uncharacterized protein LOC115899130 n=1 Tax=Rhinopithecus roxellana TaxID=61622 RepID=UPI0012373B62|nr:uncharacterized protein LOC115899130 [Rhinopithecus roxellana]
MEPGSSERAEKKKVSLCPRAFHVLSAAVKLQELPGVCPELAPKLSGSSFPSLLKSPPLRGLLGVVPVVLFQHPLYFLLSSGLKHTPCLPRCGHREGEKRDGENREERREERRREELQPFGEPRPRSAPVQGYDTLFGALWFPVSPSFQVSPHSPTPAVEVACGTPGPATASPGAVPVLAPRAACPPTAGVPGCVQWPDSMLACSHTSHCSMAGLPLAGIGSRPVARTERSLSG